jgi:hypothetical protein
MKGAWTNAPPLYPIAAVLPAAAAAAISSRCPFSRMMTTCWLPDDAKYGDVAILAERSVEPLPLLAAMLVLGAAVAIVANAHCS